jgi:hypothetical protein
MESHLEGVDWHRVAKELELWRGDVDADGHLRRAKEPPVYFIFSGFCVQKQTSGANSTFSGFKARRISLEC